ncbi:MAG: hypothetical protein ACTSYS_07365 [Promethearchaeota archaeon]
MSEEKKKKVEEYLEKKKETALKEKKFMNGIEWASNLVKEHKYDDAVNAYKDLIPLAEEINWLDKVKMIKDLIRDTREKQKKYLNQQEQTELLKEKGAKEKKYYEKALEIMDRAAGKYKDGDLEGAINQYKESLDLLKKINYSREVDIVSESIRKIEAEIERKKKIAIEKRKKMEEERKQLEEKEKELLKKKEQVDLKKKAEIERLKALEEKKKKEKEILESAMSTLDKANLALKEAKRMDYISIDAKKERYNEVIALYEDAASRFKEVGWVDEWDKIKETIIKIKKEREQDIEALSKKLAEKYEEIKSKQISSVVGPGDLKKDAKDKDTEELLKKKIEEKKLRDKALSTLDEASKLLDQFEKKPKIIGGQIFKENEYPEIIRLYRKALAYFKEIDWLTEAAKIEESIEILRKKEKEFISEKEAFESRESKSATSPETGEMSERDSLALKKLKRELKIDGKIKERKLKEQALREEIDSVLDGAMKFFKKNEFLKSEEEYLKAYELMKDAGWTQEAENVIDTIKMIREKREKLEQLLQQKERAVDESGSFTTGIEQISETMEMIKKQEESEMEKRKMEMLEKKASEKQKQEQLLDILTKAQNSMKEQEYSDAVLFFHKALKLAEELKWSSQIRDIRDFLIDARKKKERQQVLLHQAAEKIEMEKSTVASQEAPVKEVTRGPDEEKLLELKKLKLIQKEKEENMFKLLGNAQDARKEKRFDDAIKYYEDALKIARELEWSSQVRDIEDFINEARELKHFQETHGKDKERKVEDQVELAREIREKASTVTPAKATKEKVINRKKEEKRIGNEAYATLDDANKLLRSGHRELALESFNDALKLFDTIGWTRERDAVAQEIKKIEDKIKEEEALAAKQVEAKKIKSAYEAINDAEKALRAKQPEVAIGRYEHALEIFDSINWTKEADMIKEQIEKIKEDMNKKLVAEQASVEKSKIDKAFELIDEAKKQQRNRRIFKAVDLARDAYSIFVSLGDEWARETKQVKKFLDEIEKEKAKKEELIKKLKMGDL